jgi:hypothetical protein
MPFLRRRPQASRLPHPEDSLSKATYLSLHVREQQRGRVPDNDTPGFLMGAVAADQPECSSARSSFFILFMASLTGVFWFVVAYISFATRGNISFQRNLNCKAVAGSAVTK